jgi:hypothetical protein
VALFNENCWLLHLSCHQLTTLLLWVLHWGSWNSKSPRSGINSAVKCCY